MKYECKACGAYFNDLTKTVFKHHKLTIEEMFYIMKEMEAKSSLQISQEVGRGYDSMLRFVHEAQAFASLYAQGIKIEGVIKLDEVYVHSGEKGKKKERPRKRALRRRGRGSLGQDKPPVLTMLKGG